LALDVLEAFGTRNSFSTRYYQLSPDHQNLKAKIEPPKWSRIRANLQ
jgi:hypothetical protein